MTARGLIIFPSPYDPSDRESVLRHARSLEGRTLSSTIEALLQGEHRGHAEEAAAEYSVAGGKGDFGNAIEAGHFYYRPNSDSRPDFPWGDLKCTGLRLKRSGEWTPKERLVLSKIDYLRIVRQSFEDFVAGQKLSELLLVFYRYERGVAPMDLMVELVELWSPEPDDWRMFREDWEAIKALVNGGRAQDLSEGGTKCLAACTKAADSSDRTPQPFGEPAKPRAYCLKRSFIDQIFRTLKARRARESAKDVPLLGLDDYLAGGVALEDFVVRKFRTYHGAPVESIAQRLEIDASTFLGKSRHARLAWAILNRLLTGDPRTTAETVSQFRKAGIVIRTVRIKPSGKPAEDISFPAFDYVELAEEADWEDSELRALLASRFLFVFLNEGADGVRHLSHVAFWSMPEEDVEGDARAVWRTTRDLVAKSCVQGLPRGSQTKAVHVRPHDTNSEPTVRLPDGTLTFRRSFWLNKKYVAGIFARTRP